MAKQYPKHIKTKKKRRNKKKGSGCLIAFLIFVILVLLAVLAVMFGVLWMRSKMGTEIRVNNGAALYVDYSDVFREETGFSNIDEMLEGESEEVQEQVLSAGEELEKRDPEQKLELSERIENYLLIGSDRRGSSGWGNSDTMLLVTVNRATEKIHLTSFMRAMYVRIPATNGAFNGMLNWAYQVEGPSLCVQTIENNFGITIDHYCVVDFTGFEKIIEILGGVEVEVDQAECNAIFRRCGESVSPGLRTLNGAQALSYCRDRHDNDFNRTRRQRTVIDSVMNSMKNVSLSQLTSMLNEVLPYVDTDMSSGEILSFLPDVPAYLSYSRDQRMLPIENEDGKHYTGITNIGGHEMYIVNWETNLSALEEFLNS